MKKYIYLLAIIAVIAACKHPKDPEPVVIDPKGGYNEGVPEPEKPTVQLKQLIARDIQGGNGSLDYFISFTYNVDGFVETVNVVVNNSTGEKISKTINTLVYESKTKLIKSDYTTVSFNSDPSKNDTTWVTTSVVYDIDKITLKKVTTRTAHGAGMPTATYEDKEKDFIYLNLDDKNRMIKWWTSQGQSQEFEYNEKGNYIKTLTLSKYENTTYYFLYDDNINILSKIIPCSFYRRVANFSLPFWGDVLSSCNNNPIAVNISDKNQNGFVYTYEYNSQGYPTKRSSIIDPMTLEYIY